MVLDFYTSHEMTKEAFEEAVINWCLKSEETINSLAPTIRVHVKESPDQAE